MGSGSRPIPLHCLPSSKVAFPPRHSSRAMSEPSDEDLGAPASADPAPPRHVSFSPGVRSPPPPLPPCVTGEAAGHQHHRRQHPLAPSAGHLHPVSLLERPGCSFVIPCPVASACPVQRARELEDEEDEEEQRELGEPGDGNDAEGGDPSAGMEAPADAAGSEGCSCEPLRRAASPPPSGPDRGDRSAARGCACALLAPYHWELLVALLRGQGGDQPSQLPQAPPLQLGTAAPSFTCKALMPDQSFAEVRLSDYRGRYVVLIFYPADFTFVCPTEIVAFSDRAEDFRRVNCDLLLCSTDSHFVHLAWTKVPRAEGGLGSVAVPLLADRSQAVSRAYGVLKEDEGVAYRGLFIISDHGVLRQITVNDLPVGRSVDETLRLVQAFQFADRHGEVCPANWKPGDRTMKADPQLSKEYFKSGEEKIQAIADVSSDKKARPLPNAGPAAVAPDAPVRRKFPPWGSSENFYKAFGFAPGRTCSCSQRH